MTSNCPPPTEGGILLLIIGEPIRVNGVRQLSWGSGLMTLEDNAV